MAGDTVLVSTAGGAVGSLSSVRSHGTWVPDPAGTDRRRREGRALPVERYGYADAWNYKHRADWAAGVRIRRAPTGLNVYFDNVGGAILDVALRRMAVAGRIVQCGTASVASWTPPPTGPRNEREILTRRLVWSGFVVFDHVVRFGAAADALVAWYREGKIVYDEDIADGIVHAPGAIKALYSGENRGKKLIYVG